jgi:hypothetical protein
MLRSHVAVSLQNINDDFLVGVRMNPFRRSDGRLLATNSVTDLYVFFSLLWTAARIVFAPTPAADVGFVHFYNAGHFRDCWLLARFLRSHAAYFFENTSNLPAISEPRKERASVVRDMSNE